MKTAYITHPDCALHRMGLFHPESPNKLRNIETRLQSCGIYEKLFHYESISATRKQLQQVHSNELIQYLETKNLEIQIPNKNKLLRLGADLLMNKHTLRAAYLAAGATVLAVDLIMKKEVEAAFCAVRPGGHHAERNQSMGFCFFNNIAVGAAHALTTYKLNRIAIIDFDVHHGNGTEDIFKENDRVLFCNSFQYPLYPDFTLTKNSANLINVPFPVNTYGAEFRSKVKFAWFSKLEQFKPEMIFICAGFDAHKDDPLADLFLDESDFSWLTEEIVSIAQKVSNGRIVSLLSGGYNQEALAKCVAAHISVLLNH